MSYYVFETQYKPPARTCTKCREHMPPNTEHFVYEDEPYCLKCIEARPYTAYCYYLDGDFIGLSEDEEVQRIESYDDEYEEVEE